VATPFRPLTALLFTPGNRPERVAKAAGAGADGVIIDWEDAVPAAEKDAVRAATISRLREQGPVAPAPFVTAVRINDLRSAAGRADLDALNAAGLRLDAVVIPKVEDPDEVREAARRLFGAPRLVCLIETVLGVRHAAAIATASPQVAALAFGGFDLSAETGGEPVWDALLWPRTQVVHACAAAGVAALDQPFIDLADEAGLAAECARVRALGFTGKLAIHPRQCPVIRSAFRPAPEQVEAARRVVAASTAAAGGVATVDGRMVDVPMFRAAKRVLERAGE
jgi:(S)-citramalyl-CoA lyase